MIVYIYIYIINKHNKQVTTANPATPKEQTCNCQNQEECPLDNHCLSNNVIYKAQVTTSDDIIGKCYIGLTEGTFKQRCMQHKLSFRNRKYGDSTELSKHIWSLKDSKKDYDIKWSIIAKARPYNNISRKCDLCVTEKLYIIKANSHTLLNKRSEFISKCRHENKYYLKNA